MKAHIGTVQIILLLAWVASGECWPTIYTQNKVDIKITRDSQPTISPIGGNNTITVQTVELSKKINTPLGGLVLLLTVGTYILLMKYTAPLSNEIILPSKFIEDNIGAILSAAWPKSYFGSPEEPFPRYTSNWLLFYAPYSKLNAAKGTIFNEDTLHLETFRELQGFSQLETRPTTFLSGRTPTVTIKVFSPVVKGLVQIAIWNSVSFWLVIVMFMNTLVYNGYTSQNVTIDSVVRLFLVSVYAAATIGYQVRATKLLYHNFTWMIFQICWTTISKQFVFLDYADYFVKLAAKDDSKHVSDLHNYSDGDRRGDESMIWTSLNLELFGTTERANTYRLPLEDSDQIYDHTVDLGGQILSSDDKRLESHLMARETTASKFDKLVKLLRDAEIKAYEKAVDSALEKILANIVVLLGICLATVLAPWTSIQTFNATNAQLGSYALLASISTGLLALVSSLTQLTNAMESAKTLLLLQEKTIEADYRTHENENISGEFSLQEIPSFSFSSGITGSSVIAGSSGIAGSCDLTSFRLWRSMSFVGKLPGVLLGSALALIPRLSLYDQTNGYDISVKVQDVEVSCRTNGYGIGDMFYVKSSSRSPLDGNLAYEQEDQRAAKTERDEESDERQQIPETKGIPNNPDTVVWNPVARSSIPLRPFDRLTGGGQSN